MAGTFVISVPLEPIARWRYGFSIADRGGLMGELSKVANATGPATPLAADESKTLTLTLRLLHKGKSVKEAFTDAPPDSALMEWAHADGATCYVGQVFDNPPSWRSFVLSGNPDLPTASLTSSGAAAIVFVPVAGRILAVCFGHAHIPLNLDAFERQFGLRVTLNVVPRDGLRTLDVATPDAVTFQRRIQASKDADVGEFGIDYLRDLARVAGGTPNDQGFASFVAGKDSLSITCKVSPETLRAKCLQVMAAFKSNEYKKSYEWIDNLSRVEIKETSKKLDKLLFDEILAMMAGGVSDLHMSPPEIVDYMDGSLLHYNGFGSAGKNFHRLSIKDYISELVRCDFDGSLEDIKKLHRVKAARPGSEELSERWKVYDCFIFETSLPATADKYVLYAGEWYKVSQKFNQHVSQFIANLPKKVIVASTSAKNEQELIEELKKRSDLVLLDQTKINPGGVSYGNLEPCDFFSSAKQFIHLKDGHSSGPISHLWMQGVVSAEAFGSDKKFRADLRKTVQSLPGGFEKFLPDGRSEPVRSEFEIVFGVMRQPYKDGTLGLPFFSQVSLMAAADRLKQLGFPVALNLIEKK